MNIPKFTFITSLSICAIGLSVYLGITLNDRKIITYKDINNFKDTFTNVIKETPNITKTSPKYFLTKTKHKGEAVTINDKNHSNQDEYIFINGFFEDSNELRLIKRDGTIINRWTVSFSKIFGKTDKEQFIKYPETDWNIDLHGTEILPDGSVIFNFEYAGTVKLDRCGNEQWKLAGYNTHHSAEIASDGNFWLLGRKKIHDNSTNIYSPYEDDLILKVSKEGKIIEEISITEMFLKDVKLTSLLTATGHKFRRARTISTWVNELFHTNKIEEIESLPKDYKGPLKVGNLIISTKRQNLLFAVDVEKKEIIWHKIGGWIRQHDPELKGEYIYIFNNEEFKDNKFTLRSNIMRHNIMTDETEVIYGDRDNESFRTKIRGEIDLRPNSNILVTEPQNGRIFEFNKNRNIVWEYINKSKKGYGLRVNGAKAYNKNYFKANNWTCPTSAKDH